MWEEEFKELRDKVSLGLVSVIATTVASLFLARLIDFSDIGHSILQSIGAILVVWAVLGRLGWKQKTYGENSPPEKWDRRLFWIKTLLGLFLTQLSILDGLL